MDDEKKDDHIEIEFEIGDIEFEARGRSDVVERMFKLLMEKLESGGLVATLELPEEGEWDEEAWDEDEEWDEEDDSFEYDVEEDDESETYNYDDDEEESYEYDEGEPTDHEEDSGNDEDKIPREAYLDPPPDWDKLEEETPPITESEKESDELKRDY